MDDKFKHLIDNWNDWESNKGINALIKLCSTNSIINQYCNKHSIWKQKSKEILRIE
jgi:hypothetical protein